MCQIEWSGQPFLTGTHEPSANWARLVYVHAALQAIKWREQPPRETRISVEVFLGVSPSVITNLFLIAYSNRVWEIMPAWPKGRQKCVVHQ